MIVRATSDSSIFFLSARFYSSFCCCISLSRAYLSANVALVTRKPAWALPTSNSMNEQQLAACGGTGSPSLKTDAQRPTSLFGCWWPACSHSWHCSSALNSSLLILMLSAGYTTNSVRGCFVHGSGGTLATAGAELKDHRGSRSNSRLLRTGAHRVVTPVRKATEQVRKLKKEKRRMQKVRKNYTVTLQSITFGDKTITLQNTLVQPTAQKLTKPQVI